MTIDYLHGFINKCISLGIPIELTKQAWFGSPLAGTLSGTAIGTIIDQLYNRINRKPDDTEEAPTILKSLSRGGLIGGASGLGLGSLNKAMDVSEVTNNRITNMVNILGQQKFDELLKSTNK